MSSLLKTLIVKLLRRPASRYVSELQLSETTAPSDPIVLFTEWFELISRIDPEYANAVTLSTATNKAVPSNRIVLLKGYDSKGFVFYTNYTSRKAGELDENPQASMVFWWKELHRQVRIEGTIKRVSASESDAYFASRGRGSKLGAWASKQSTIIANRDELADRVNVMAEKFVGVDVPRPPFWGGYRLKPLVIEFWQARTDRLHDRLRYRNNNPQIAATNTSESWLLERLSP